MEILAAVTARLSALGYTVTETDSAALDYNINGSRDDPKGANESARSAGGSFLCLGGYGCGHVPHRQEGFRRAL